MHSGNRLLPPVAALVQVYGGLSGSGGNVVQLGGAADSLAYEGGNLVGDGAFVGIHTQDRQACLYTEGVISHAPGGLGSVSQLIPGVGYPLAGNPQVESLELPDSPGSPQL